MQQQLQDDVKQKWEAYKAACNKLVAMSGGTLQQLPNEVMDRILQYLPENKMFRLRMVCKAFHEGCWRVLQQHRDQAYSKLAVGDLFYKWGNQEVGEYYHVTGLRQQRDGLYVFCEDECGTKLRRKVKRTKTYVLYVQDYYMHIKPQL